MSIACVLALAGLAALPASAGTTSRAVVVTGLSRHHEPTWGGDWIKVTGSGFQQQGRRAVAAAYFGRFKAAHTRVLDDHTLMASTPEVDGARKVVSVVVKLRNGVRSKKSSAGRFTFVVPTVRTPIHDGLSTLQSRALGAKVIRRVKHTKAPPLARRSPSWTLAEGRSVVRRAKRWLGMPYTWGGGNAKGPTYGSPYGNGLLGHFDATFRGFDCSGLTLFAWAPYRKLPHYSGSQYGAAGRFHPTRDEYQPGDLLFFSAGGKVIDHVVIYAGHGTVVQAPESGHVVQVSKLADVLRLEPHPKGATRPASKARGAGPRITSLSASEGSVVGGQTIVIRGTDLDTTSRIRFGTAATYSFTVVSAHEVRVTVPAGHVGTVPVRLGNAWGVSPAVSAASYTYSQTS